MNLPTENTEKTLQKIGISKPERKHQKFVKKIVQGKSPELAYQSIYKCTDISARTGSNLLLQKPEIREDIRNQLDRQGISTEYLNGKLKKIIDQPIKHFVTKNGDDIVVEDNHLRLEAIKHGHKLHGLIDKPANNITLQDNRSITFNQSGKNEKELATIFGAIITKLQALQSEPDSIGGEIISQPPIDAGQTNKELVQGRLSPIIGQDITSNLTYTFTPETLPVEPLNKVQQKQQGNQC